MSASRVSPPRRWGPFSGTSEVTRLAHWAGEVYGFTSGGNLLRCAPTGPAAATTLDDTGFIGVIFRGAASRVSAPTQ